MRNNCPYIPRISHYVTLSFAHPVFSPFQDSSQWRKSSLVVVVVVNDRQNPIAVEPRPRFLVLPPPLLGFSSAWEEKIVRLMGKSSHFLLVSSMVLLLFLLFLEVPNPSPAKLRLYPSSSPLPSHIGHREVRKFQPLVFGLCSCRPCPLGWRPSKRLRCFEKDSGAGGRVGKGRVYEK